MIEEVLQVFKTKLNKYTGANLPSEVISQFAEILAKEAVNEVLFSAETIRRCLYGKGNQKC